MIYLDNAATTWPLFPDAAAKVGNPSSRTHSFGIQSRKLVEGSREGILELFDCKSGSLIFTSGATESASIIKRAFPNYTSTPTSHRCFLNEDNPSKKVDLFSYELVNNETGIVTPDMGSEFCVVARDISQALTKLDSLNVGVGFSFGSAHKFHGVMGVGFIVADQVESWEMLRTVETHGGQERGIRPGTLNAPAIIQTGEVAKWMLKNGDEYRAKLKHLQSTFENKIKSLTDCWIIGADQERAPHITSLNLPGVDNEALIAAVNDRLAIASGSACTSEKVEPSHVLMAMFNDREIADTTVRISYGWFNTEAEVLEAAEIIAKAAETIRSFSL